MSTVSTTGGAHHSFPMPLALAAASAALLVGGLTGYGISAAQDDAAPAESQVSTTTTHNQQCPDDRCMPHQQQQPRGGTHNSRSIEQTLPGGGPGTAVGGQTQIGLP